MQSQLIGETGQRDGNRKAYSKGHKLAWLMPWGVTGKKTFRKASWGQIAFLSSRLMLKCEPVVIN